MSSKKTPPNNPAKSHPSSAISSISAKWISRLRRFRASAIGKISKAWDHIVLRVRDLKGSKAGWRPKEIALPWMISLLLLEAGIISTIVVLLTISNKRSGFVGLTDPPRFLLGDPLLANALWNGFLYTAVPTFLMTCYNSLRDATLTAVLDRQPFVDLESAKADRRTGRPQVTIMLEYSKVSWWKRGYKALRNGHYVIAACVIVGNIYSLVVIPSTAHLFTDVSFDTNNTLPGLVTKAFDSTVFSQADFTPAFDTVTAVQMYGANQPAWTNSEYAFPAFAVNVTSGNVTAESLGYSANLACREIPQSEYVIQYDNSSFTISGSDRGCNISEPVPLSTQAPVFVWTLPSQQPCSLQSGSSRLLIISGNSTDADPKMLSNFSFISCIPTYWTTPGNLTVTFGLTTEPFVASFAPREESASQFFLDSGPLYETELLNLQGFDIESNLSANDFGLLVYNFAQKLDPQSPLDTQLLEDSTVIIFASIFAVFSSSVFFQPASPPADMTVTVTQPVSRLVVVPPVAYIILGIMSVAFLLTITLLFYASRPSILLEEPIGLLGAAAILHGSDIMGIVEQTRSEAMESGRHFDGKVTKLVSEMYDMSDVSCYRDGETPDYKIKVEPKGLNKKGNTVTSNRRFSRLRGGWRKQVATRKQVCNTEASRNAEASRNTSQ
jgi:hypothetical protein